MTKEEFISTIKEVVVEESIKSIQANLTKPSGRSPQKKYIIQSEWFNRLQNEDRKLLMEVVRETAETTVFGFLCVLDGVRAIEDSKPKGQLNLYYQKGEKEILLNASDETYLHDLF